MAENIDELQIEIESDASDATDGLERLTKTLEKLKKAVSGIESTSAGLKSLVSPLRSLSKLDNLNLTANIAQLNELNNTIKNMKTSDFSDFWTNANLLSNGVSVLSKIKTGNMGTVSSKLDALVKSFDQFNGINMDFGPQLNAVSTAVSSMVSSSEALKKVDFTSFKANIETLADCLQPLQGFKTQASNLLTSLRGFPESAQELNNFDGFETFKKKIETLAGALKPLSEVNSKLGATLNAMSQLPQVSGTLDKMDFTKFKMNVSTLAGSFEDLQNVNTRLGATFNQLSRLGTISTEVNKAMASNEFIGNVKELGKAIKPLSEIGKINLNPVLNQLERIPKVAQALDYNTVDQFTSSVRKLTEALSPLATEMNTVTGSFASLPNGVRGTIRATNQIRTGNDDASSSFDDMTTSVSRSISKFMVLYYAAKRVKEVFAKLFEESSSYIESLNLFTITMGESADEAKAFAMEVQNLMGIDISEWFENQGVFQQLTSGFGIASDQASVMSQNLTQMGYDMASFFNTDVETAMQKLQSGMSGQIKGLKAFGINLSVAALQETALSLGIEQSVRSMTEAQKAQLRYITIMQKSQNIMGDMARTIATPANAMRILSAQTVQLERALGNIVSVLATGVIPYVQVFVRLMTDAAEYLADLMGFQLPTIEPPNVDGIYSGVDEELDDTIDKTKELQRQLMGFDELNILKSNKQEDKEASFDLGIELPEYDFLDGIDNSVNELYEDVKEAIGIIAKLAPIALGLGAALKWAFAADVVGDFVDVAGDATVAASRFMGVTGPSKAKARALEFAAFAASFAATAIGIKAAAKGTTSWTVAIGGATIATTLAGYALSSFIGPAGWVIAGMGAMTGAVVGYEAAMLELSRDKTHEQFFDGLGSSISDVAEEFTNITGTYTNYTNAILSNHDAFEANKQSIQNNSNAINDMLAVMQISSDEIASQYVPQIRDAFVELERAVSENLILVNDNITMALATAPEEALQRLGISTTRIQEIIGGATSAANAELDTLIQQSEALTDALEADPNNEGLAKQLIDVKNQILAITSETNPALNEFKATLDLSNINFESPEKALAGITSIRDAYDEGVAAVSESTKAMLEELESLSRWMSEEDKNKVETFILSLDATKKQELLDEYGKFGEAVIAEFERKMTEGVENYDFALWQEAWAKLMVSEDLSLTDAKGFVWAESNDFGEIYEALAGIKTTLETDKAELETLFGELGNTATSFTNGVTNNIEPAKTAGADLGAAAATGIEAGITGNLANIEAAGKAAGQAFGKGFNSGVPAFQFQMPGVSGSYTRFKPIEQYESGGFPVNGDLFFANEGVPELVGRIGNKAAVANNDQITQGIASAVYEAMMAAREDSNDSGGGSTSHFTLQFGNQVIGELAVEYINGRIEMTGFNPINA